MKKIIIVLIISIVSFACYSQETNVYTFFLNVVNDNFKFPLIGFVNMAKGDHKGVQLGFVNWNVRHFSGIQMGMVNTLGADLTGAQLAYINTSIQQVRGIQMGFINSAGQEVRGAQVGFINTALNEVNGIQVGFINTAKQGVNGMQVSFVNTALQTVTGAQIGYVNTAIQTVEKAQIGFVNTAIKESHGPQIGFVNIANRKKSGIQVGFVNYADTIEKGVPVGFLSIIRRGGYYAFEVGYSDFFPLTVGFKTGVEKFYTTLYLAYRPSGKSPKNVYASGFGFGSIIPLQKSLFFNPEILSMNTIEKNNRQLISFVPMMGVHLNNHLSLTAGPTVTWSNSIEDKDVLKPVFNIADFDIDKNNRIFVGAKAGLRVRF